MSAVANNVPVPNNNDPKKPSDDKKPVDKIWNDSEVQLLKKWGEMSSSYRLLHDRAFREYQLKSYGLTIPVIILSTLTGTASFSIGSFPIGLQPYVPMVIGGVNIIVGIIQTVSQFLRVNELTESHRVASITYGKLARNITTELSLPPKGRTYNGIDFVQMCRTEMDRLIEQSPIIPMDVLNTFDNTAQFKDITKPEVLTISSIVEYQPSKDEKVVEMMANVANKINTNQKNDKTVAQKIKEEIEKRINPNKIEKDVIPQEIKDAILHEVDIETGQKHMDDLAANIISNRTEELKNIGSGGVVSKMLSANQFTNQSNYPNKPGIDLKKLSETIAKK